VINDCMIPISKAVSYFLLVLPSDELPSGFHMEACVTTMVLTSMVLSQHGYGTRLKGRPGCLEGRRQG
jgi:hypothetical protein